MRSNETEIDKRIIPQPVDSLLAVLMEKSWDCSGDC